jgi:hypothetical protein
MWRKLIAVFVFLVGAFIALAPQAFWVSWPTAIMTLLGGIAICWSAVSIWKTGTPISN